MTIVIRMPNGTLMFPTWKTRAFIRYRRIAGNVVVLQIKRANVVDLKPKQRSGGEA